MKWIICFLLLVPSVASPDYIYHWVDKDGIRHYSNTSGGENAETIQEQKASKPETPALTPEQRQSIDRDAASEKKSADELKAIKEKVKARYQNRITVPVQPAPEIKKTAEIPPTITMSTPTYDANNKTVSITGRIQAYQTVKYVTVSAYVIDNKGFKTVITCFAADISGGTTKLLQGSKTFYGERGSNWKLISFDSAYK